MLYKRAKYMNAHVKVQRVYLGSQEKLGEEARFELGLEGHEELPNLMHVGRTFQVGTIVHTKPVK